MRQTRQPTEQKPIISAPEVVITDDPAIGHERQTKGLIPRENNRRWQRPKHISSDRHWMTKGDVGSNLTLGPSTSSDQDSPTTASALENKENRGTSLVIVNSQVDNDGDCGTGDDTGVLCDNTNNADIVPMDKNRDPADGHSSCVRRNSKKRTILQKRERQSDSARSKGSNVCSATATTTITAPNTTTSTLTTRMKQPQGNGTVVPHDSTAQSSRKFWQSKAVPTVSAVVGRVNMVDTVDYNPSPMRHMRIQASASPLGKKVDADTIIEYNSSPMRQSRIQPKTIDPPSSIDRKVDVDKNERSVIAERVNNVDTIEYDPSPIRQKQTKATLNSLSRRLDINITAEYNSSPIRQGRIQSKMIGSSLSSGVNVDVDKRGISSTPTLLGRIHSKTGPISSRNWGGEVNTVECNVFPMKQSKRLSKIGRVDTEKFEVSPSPVKLSKKTPSPAQDVDTDTDGDEDCDTCSKDDAPSVPQHQLPDVKKRRDAWCSTTYLSSIKKIQPNVVASGSQEELSVTPQHLVQNVNRPKCQGRGVYPPSSSNANDHLITDEADENVIVHDATNGSINQFKRNKHPGSNGATINNNRRKWSKHRPQSTKAPNTRNELQELKDERPDNVLQQGKSLPPQDRNPTVRVLPHTIAQTVEYNSSPPRRRRRPTKIGQVDMDKFEGFPSPMKILKSGSNLSRDADVVANDAGCENYPKEDEPPTTQRPQDATRSRSTRCGDAYLSSIKNIQSNNRASIPKTEEIPVVLQHLSRVDRPQSQRHGINVSSGFNNNAKFTTNVGDTDVLVDDAVNSSNSQFKRNEYQGSHGAATGNIKKWSKHCLQATTDMPNGNDKVQELQDEQLEHVDSLSPHASQCDQNPTDNLISSTTVQIEKRTKPFGSDREPRSQPFPAWEKHKLRPTNFTKVEKSSTMISKHTGDVEQARNHPGNSYSSPNKKGPLSIVRAGVSFDGDRKNIGLLATPQRAENQGRIICPSSVNKSHNSTDVCNSSGNNLVSSDCQLKVVENPESIGVVTCNKKNSPNHRTLSTRTRGLANKQELVDSRVKESLQQQSPTKLLKGRQCLQNSADNLALRATTQTKQSDLPPSPNHKMLTTRTRGLANKCQESVDLRVKESLQQQSPNKLPKERQCLQISADNQASLTITHAEQSDLPPWKKRSLRNANIAKIEKIGVTENDDNKKEAATSRAQQKRDDFISVRERLRSWNERKGVDSDRIDSELNPSSSDASSTCRELLAMHELQNNVEGETPLNNGRVDTSRPTPQSCNANQGKVGTTKHNQEAMIEQKKGFIENIASQSLISTGDTSNSLIKLSASRKWDATSNRKDALNSVASHRIFLPVHEGNLLWQNQNQDSCMDEVDSDSDKPDTNTACSVTSAEQIELAENASERALLDKGTSERPTSQFGVLSNPNSGNLGNKVPHLEVHDNCGKSIIEDKDADKNIPPNQKISPRQVAYNDNVTPRLSAFRKWDAIVNKKGPQNAVPFKKNSPVFEEDSRGLSKSHGSNELASDKRAIEKKGDGDLSSEMEQKIPAKLTAGTVNDPASTLSALRKWCMVTNKNLQNCTAFHNEAHDPKEYLPRHGGDSFNKVYDDKKCEENGNIADPKDKGTVEVHILSQEFGIVKKRLTSVKTHDTGKQRRKLVDETSLQNTTDVIVITGLKELNGGSDEILPSSPSGEDVAKTSYRKSFLTSSASKNRVARMAAALSATTSQPDSGTNASKHDTDEEDSHACISRTQNKKPTSSPKSKQLKYDLATTVGSTSVKVELSDDSLEMSVSTNSRAKAAKVGSICSQVESLTNEVLVEKSEDVTTSHSNLMERNTEKVPQIHDVELKSKATVCHNFFSILSKFEPSKKINPSLEVQTHEAKYSATLVEKLHPHLESTDENEKQDMDGDCKNLHNEDNKKIVEAQAHTTCSPDNFEYGGSEKSMICKILADDVDPPIMEKCKSGKGNDMESHTSSSSIISIQDVTSTNISMFNFDEKDFTFKVEEGVVHHQENNDDDCVDEELNRINQGLVKMLPHNNIIDTNEATSQDSAVAHLVCLDTDPDLCIDDEEINEQVAFPLNSNLTISGNTLSIKSGSTNKSMFRVQEGSFDVAQEEVAHHLTLDANETSRSSNGIPWVPRLDKNDDAIGKSSFSDKNGVSSSGMGTDICDEHVLPINYGHLNGPIMSENYSDYRPGTPLPLNDDDECMHQHTACDVPLSTHGGYEDYYQTDIQNYYDDESCAGVTLSPRTSEVSSLSIPSCLQDCELSSELNSSSDEDTRAMESATEKQSSAKGPSEASSSQSSEAATPLIHSTLCTLNMKLGLSSISDESSGFEAYRKRLLDMFPSVTDDSYNDEVSQGLILQQSHVQPPYKGEKAPVEQHFDEPFGTVSVDGIVSPVVAEQKLSGDTPSCWGEVNQSFSSTTEICDNGECANEWTAFAKDEIDDKRFCFAPSSSEVCTQSALLRRLNVSEDGNMVGDSKEPSSKVGSPNPGLRRPDASNHNNLAKGTHHPPDLETSNPIIIGKCDNLATSPKFQHTTGTTNVSASRMATTMLRDDLITGLRTALPPETNPSTDDTKTEEEDQILFGRPPVAQPSTKSSPRASPPGRRANLHKVIAYQKARRQTYTQR